MQDKDESNWKSGVAAFLMLLGAMWLVIYLLGLMGLQLGPKVPLPGS